MTSLTDTASCPRLHMIGNAHLDPVWLWCWQDGCAEAIGTCWAAVDRLEEGDAFIFTRGEARIYQWIEDYEPALFEKIRQFVRDGRWVVVNGWWVQPDCNVPSGESVIRQALYGKAYFKDRFGIDVPTGYNVDSFGHPHTYPMLMRHTGTRSYTFMRPGPHEKALPSEFFNWRSSDGSVVPTFRIQDSYLTSNRDYPLAPKIDEHFDHARRMGHDIMCFYGVGNHGGGPTIANIAEIDRRRSLNEPLEYSDPNRFFEGTDSANLPVVDEELQFHAIGCYAAASRLKALNRQAESLLEQAETAATLAHRVSGAPYPKERLTALWKTLLFNQFHDTIGGTSVEQACIDSEADFGAIISGASEELNAAARHLCAQVTRVGPHEDAVFVVMNFTGASSDGLVEVAPWIDKDSDNRRILLDEDGNHIPFQYIAPHGKTNGLKRIAFRLETPAFGYRTLRFAVDEVDGVPAPSVHFGTPCNTDEPVFETEGYRLELDPASGAITSLMNRKTGHEFFDGPAHEAIAVEDKSDTWSHALDRFGTQGRPFQLVTVDLLDSGPVRSLIAITTAMGRSSMKTEIVLPADPDLPVDLAINLDWRENHSLLRLAYPVGADKLEYEIPGGWDERPADAREYPGHRWVRASREHSDIMIANTGKYSYAAQDGTLYVTAVRSPAYAHHDPVELDGDASHRIMDQGPQQFRMRFASAPSLPRIEAVRLAEQLCKPVFVTPHVSRLGRNALSGSWLNVASETCAVTALKLAEKSEDLIIRAIEIEGRTGVLDVEGSVLNVPSRGIASGLLSAGTLRACNGLEE